MTVQNKILRYLVVLLQRLGGKVHVSSQDLEDTQHLNAVEIIQSHGDGADLELTDLRKVSASSQFEKCHQAE